MDDLLVTQEGICGPAWSMIIYSMEAYWQLCNEELEIKIGMQDPKGVEELAKLF